MKLHQLSRSTKLFIFAITSLILGLGCFILIFGPTNLSGDAAAVPAIVGALSIAAFVILTVSSLIALWNERTPKNKNPQRGGRSSWIWKFFLIVSIWQIFSIIHDWNSPSAVDVLGTFPHARWIGALTTLIFEFVVVWAWRWSTKLSWSEALFGFGGMKTYDEREQQIVTRATSTTLYLVMVLLILLSAMLPIFPSTTPIMYASVMSSVVGLTIGLRGFFAWKFGLR